ncbi:MAG TPA: hypothetical protein VHM89_09220 [Acidimicrobiales bacterium]|nr:hypothetical protein [Acidimicrobiales bacterium]
MRRLLALVAGAVAASAGALILGEYELTGFTPVVAGLLFGVIVAEVVMVAGKRQDTVAAAGCAAFAAAGMVWAAWISSGEDWSYVPGGVWFGVALAAAAAAVWIRSPGRRGAGNRRAP